MKLNKILIAITALLFLISYSCEDMNELHKTYLERGESIYAAKVDSMSSGPGKERIELEIFIVSQRIDYVRIYWDAREKFVDVQIDNKTGIFKAMIDNLHEKEYLFQAVSFDKYGNKSLSYEVAGVAYGEVYRKSLPNRRIDNIKKTSEGAEFTWIGLSENAINTELVYQDIHGVTQTRSISPSTEKDTVPNFPPNGEFVYKTSYKPALNSPDMFYTDESTGNFPE